MVTAYINDWNVEDIDFILKMKKYNILAYSYLFHTAINM